MKRNFAIAVIAIWFPSGIAVAQTTPSAVKLITAQEAQLPPAIKAELTSRAGVTRGPKILVVSPARDANVKAPVHLQLKFQGFGGAKIDLASVKITYLKDPLVDLTERLRSATGAGGVDVLAADIPPGIHKIRVDLQDSNGRPGTAEFAIKVGE